MPINGTRLPNAFRAALFDSEWVPPRSFPMIFEVVFIFRPTGLLLIKMKMYFRQDWKSMAFTEEIIFNE